MSEMMETKRKLRVLCLHGARTSGRIMESLVRRRWDKSVLDRLHMVFLDAPLPTEDKPSAQAVFPPPYFKWFEYKLETNQYWFMDECIAHIEDYMKKHGPFEGFLAFSQGAILAAALVGLQAKGLALTTVPPIRFLIVLSAMRIEEEYMREAAYSKTIQCPSLHFLGDKDARVKLGEKLVHCFKDPVVIRHPMGHTIPKLDKEGTKIFISFLDRIEGYVLQESSGSGATIEEQHRNLDGIIRSRL